MLEDLATPYSSAEKREIAEGALDFCVRLNKGYAEFREGFM